MTPASPCTHGRFPSKLDTGRLAFIVLTGACLFEAVFVIPLDSIHEGVRLQPVHLMLGAGDLFLVMRFAVARRLPKVEPELAVLLLLITYGAMVAIVDYRSVYAFFLYILFLATLTFYLGAVRPVLRLRPELLLSPLSAFHVLYTLALLDWILLLLHLHPLPSILDQRQHQQFGALPRFEGYSALSLGVAFWLAVYFLIAYVRRSWFGIGLSLLLLALTFSAGVYIAAAMCAAVYIVVATNRLLVRLLVCFVALGVIVLALIVAVHLKTGTWSEAERLSFYLFLPGFLAHHPGGIGLGSSRSLSALFEVPMLTGGYVHHTNTESSFLDLAYELGIAGIVFYFWLWTLTLRLLRCAVETGGHVFVIVFTNLFVLVHALFTTAYFNEPRYLLVLMLMFTVWADRRRAAARAAEPILTQTPATS